MLAKRCLLISSAVTLCAGMLCAGSASAQTTTSQVAVWDTRHPSADRLLGEINDRVDCESFECCVGHRLEYLFVCPVKHSAKALLWILLQAVVGSRGVLRIEYAGQQGLEL